MTAMDYPLSIPYYRNLNYTLYYSLSHLDTFECSGCLHRPEPSLQIAQA